MDELINWDENVEHTTATAPRADTHMPPAGTNLDFHPVQESDPNFDLALANIDGDDFSFWALEHFETSNLDIGLVRSESTPLGISGFKQSSCDGCQAGGFNCKRVEEGLYKGSCKSCVALQIQCSLTQENVPSNGFSDRPPVKDWSITNDHLTSILDDVQASDPRSSSSPDFPNSANALELGIDDGQKPPTAPKVGARFSRESVRILKAWLSTHSHRPYPNDDERENLQRQTGLNKTQIANWLANARRRSKGKFQPTRSTSPSVRNWSGAVEIPQRRGGSAMDGTTEYLSPLQRWQNSPPENEPASVTAIASAILQSKSSGHMGSGLNSPFNFTDEEGTRSCKESSGSSFGTSPSSGSFASAYSQQSRGSFGSFSQRGRRRRRRRTAPKELNEKHGLNPPLKAFQCTFCTETFRTKHDWQRHEKSLHLSLERWICCPKTPRALNPETNQVCCVFCGAIDPDNAHIESHNYTSCQERQPDERMFYRKDHLRQHLKLVHGTKYQNWSMDPWKVPTPDIKSRCGFCGLVLSSWPVRVDHLAEHFKLGSDMRNWKGDWGFEPAVLSMIENAIPPFMIHDERNTPLPYQASQQSSTSPRNAYELIKLELAYFMTNLKEATGVKPPDDELQHEGCRIIFGSDVLSKSGKEPPASWIQDLIMSSDELKRRARLSPIRGSAESCLGQLKVLGKDNMFEDCPLETQLVEFVKARTLLSLTTTNDELQVEACNIIGRMEESSVMPSEDVANFLLRLIYRDSTWLSSFRQRHGLLPTTDSPVESRDKGTVNSSIHNYSQLENELGEFVKDHRAKSGVDPSDDDLRKHARCVVSKCQGAWRDTAADNAEWLSAFKQRQNFQVQIPQVVSSSNSPFTGTNPFVPNLDTTGTMTGSRDVAPSADNSAQTGTSFTRWNNPDDTTVRSSLYTQGESAYFLHGTSCYRRLARELRRFVTACMSPNNPHRHVPTDKEMQYQARWFMYDDDDPLNRTAADNAEWLLYFKRAMGMVPPADGQYDTSDLWAKCFIGGTGVETWYSGGAMMLDLPQTGSQPSPALPTTAAEAAAATTTATATSTVAATAKATAAQQVVSSVDSRMDFTPFDAVDMTLLPDQGTVFANKDFEDKLVQFAVAEVASSGRMPPDEAIQARAKEVSGMEVWQAETTSADDPVLLAKFKQLVVDKVKAVLGGHGTEETSNYHHHHQQQQQQQQQQYPQSGFSSLRHHTPERGMDAIDPGLLPALGSEVGEVRKTEASPLPPHVQVAISEKRLDELLVEMVGI